MELTEAALREIRMLSESCERSGPAHHEWLHDRLGKLMHDFDAMSLIARTAAPYAPLEVFQQREAEIVQLHARR